MSPLRRYLVDRHQDLVSLPRATRVAHALAGRMGEAASLLDVGTGDGLVAREVARLVGAKVAGVDVKLQPAPAVPVDRYDGVTLPFPDGSFEAVTLSDVLHHSTNPPKLLQEALRVAARVVVVKDHFRFGPVSERILLWMDRVGNAGQGIDVRGTYLSPSDWVELVAGAGGRVVSLTWPLRIHDLPWRMVARDELQFAAAIERIR